MWMPYEFVGLVCVLCCCWQYRVDSTSGIIAGPQCLPPPPGYALCTISCSLGRKRAATALSHRQSFMMHHLTHSAHVRQIYIWMKEPCPRRMLSIHWKSAIVVKTEKTAGRDSFTGHLKKKIKNKIKQTFPPQHPLLVVKFGFIYSWSLS